jgi:serine/threonine-protein kinase
VVDKTVVEMAAAARTAAPDLHQNLAIKRLALTDHKKDWELSSNPFYYNYFMGKYKLSKYITITGIDEANYENIPGPYQKDYFHLYDVIYKKCFLINGTINYFLNKFHTPATEADVIKEIHEELNSNGKEIEDTCSAFFKYLCRRNILVPEENEEIVFEGKPVYKEGDVIGNWNIVEVLSDKRSVDIYKAVDKKTHLVSVIKLLNRNKIADPHKYKKKEERLEREYSLLQKAKGITAISKAYGLSKDENQNAYIVLEFIKGKGLSDFLNDLESFPGQDMNLLMQNILEAFASLHQKNLIHGDIHPHNIMTDDDKTVRIIDLGFSRNAETEKNEILKSGGVNYYMPPERINISSVKKYSKEPDMYSDVYQIGLLLYLIVYNSVPFKGFIWEELAQNIKEQIINYPEISFWNEPVSTNLINILKKSLNKEPSERYADACSILKDFKKSILAKTSV